MKSRQSILIIAAILTAAAVTPILIRYAQNEGIPSIVLIFIRLWLIVLALAPIVWRRYPDAFSKLTIRQWGLCAFAGFWMAMNLLMLFYALEYTTVLVTSVLRRTTPLWIIAPEVLFLGALFSRRLLISVIVSFIGVLMISVGGAASLELGNQPLIGAAMASFGAICLGIYLLIGRSLRDALPSLAYSLLVFFVGALIISLVIIVTRTPILGYSPLGYLWAFVIFFFAQVLGQVFINLGLQRFSATAMAVFLQVSVVISAIIAVFTFNEIPTTWQIIGSVLVIVGVLLITYERNERVPVG